MEFYANKKLSYEAKGVLSELLSGNKMEVVEIIDFEKVVRKQNMTAINALNELFLGGYIKFAAVLQGRIYFEAFESVNEEDE